MALDASFWRDRRVLVTGHTGFAGSWLVLWLEALGADVAGLSRGATPGGRGFAGDVGDAAFVAAALAEHRPEVLVHLAGESIVGRAAAHPVRTVATNVLATTTLLDAACRAPELSGVVILSTQKVYARPAGPEGHREDDPLGGRDPYSTSCAARDVIAAGLREQFGLPVASARASNLIGGGDWGEGRLVPDVMRAWLTGATTTLREPDAVRPWQHVLDALHGCLLLAQALSTGQEPPVALNLAPAPELAAPVGHVIDELNTRLGRPVAVAGSGSGRASTDVLDIRLAERCLGWRARWDLARSLDAVVDWYGAHGRGEDVRAVALAQLEAFAADVPTTLPQP